jgi:hypothetical protein
MLISVSRTTSVASVSTFSIKSISYLYLDDTFIIEQLLKKKCFDDADLNQDGVVTEEEIAQYEEMTGEKYKPSI